MILTRESILKNVKEIKKWRKAYQSAIEIYKAVGVVQRLKYFPYKKHWREKY